MLSELPVGELPKSTKSPPSRNPQPAVTGSHSQNTLLLVAPLKLLVP